MSSTLSSFQCSILKNTEINRRKEFHKYLLSQLQQQQQQQQQNKNHHSQQPHQPLQQPPPKVQEDRRNQGIYNQQLPQDHYKNHHHHHHQQKSQRQTLHSEPKRRVTFGSVVFVEAEITMDEILADTNPDSKSKGKLIQSEPPQSNPQEHSNNDDKRPSLSEELIYSSNSDTGEMNKDTKIPTDRVSSARPKSGWQRIGQYTDVVMYAVLVMAAVLCLGVLLFNLKSLVELDFTDIRNGVLSDVYILLGLFIVGRWVYQAFHFISAQLKNNDIVFRTHGTWAVVTGCTNGIGREFALQLAAKGMNLCLISRNMDLLNELAKKISDEYCVRTVVVQADFNDISSLQYDVIENYIRNLDIGVLVNNVGISNNKPDFFHGDTCTSQLIQKLIHVNMISLAKMTQLVLPNMVKRRRGIIINLSSGTGRQPTPLLSTYGATKGFVDFFSRSLAEEYKKFGIFIQSLTPWFVSTPMTKHIDTRPLIPTAERYVRHALATVPWKSQTYGYWPHSVQGFVLENAPAFIVRLYAKRVSSMDTAVQLRNERLAKNKENA